MEKKRILIVDDSPEWIKFHLQGLELSFGEDFFNIDVTFSAHDGIKAVEENEPYDLILSDLQMEIIPGETYAGMWMVKRLKNHPKCADTKFIVISASYEIAQIARILGTAYIPKGSLIDNIAILQYKISELLDIREC